MPHVVIIGAGPAGSTAAILLARAGFQVELLEQHRFPRDKVCGECLSALGIAVLTRARVGESIGDLHPAVLTRAVLHAPAGECVEVRLDQSMWGVSRAALDSLLLDHARDAGAIVHQPARCEQVTPRLKPIVRWRSLIDNREHETRCDWVLVADGKGALPSHAPAASGDFAIKAHFMGVDGPRDAIELFGVTGHYGGLAAIERDDVWNAAFTVPAARLRAHGGDIEAMFDEVLSENQTLGTRLRRARRAGGWLAAPLPRFSVASRWSEHVIPLGNAAAAIEPIGGEGMGLAIRSAELAATALIAMDATADASLLSELPGRFAEHWRLPGSVCRLVSRLLSMPSLVDASAALALANPRLLQAVMGLIKSRRTTA